jgi:hypothetical protein
MQIKNYAKFMQSDYAKFRRTVIYGGIFETLSSIGLTRKADNFLRPYVNTGTLNSTVSGPATATPGYSLTTANNTLMLLVLLLLIIYRILVLKVEYLPVLQLLIVLLDHI